jgi:aspartate-semialdehyde dehydrogenase
MPSFERESQRIVIAGASSLLGAELKSLLEESKFAGWDLRLVDEELAAGTLTEAGGEPAVIQPVEEGSFDQARFIFFTSSSAFVERNRESAERAENAGATVFDFTGKFWTKDLAACPSFPKLDHFWGVHSRSGAKHNPSAGSHHWIISAAGVAVASLTFGLRGLGLKKLTVVFFRPVSEAGRAGIEELESQSGQLLSFQSIGQPVFDTQVAFNILQHYGPASPQSLDAARSALREEVSACVQNQGAVMPSIQVLHAPTFYGMAFTACAELDPGLADREAIVKACREAGFTVAEETNSGPSNVAVAGETTIQLGIPQSDPLNHGTWWFWGAADNIRLPAWNAVKLAEKLVP